MVSERKREKTSVDDEYSEIISAYRKHPNETQKLYETVQLLQDLTGIQGAVQFFDEVFRSHEFDQRTDRFKKEARNIAISFLLPILDKEVSKGHVRTAHRLLDTLSGVKNSTQTRKLDEELDYLRIRGLHSPGTDLIKVKGSSSYIDPDDALEHKVSDQVMAWDQFFISMYEQGEDALASQFLARETVNLSYPLAVCIMKQYAKSGACMRTPLGGKAVKMLLYFLDLIKTDINKNKIVSESVFVNTHYPYYSWREKFIFRYGLEELRECFTINGLDRIDRALKDGKGVVLLNSHFPSGRFLMILLNLMGYKISSLEWANRLSSLNIQAAEGLEVLELTENKGFPLKALVQARNSLKRGEVLSLSGDGFRGQKGIATPFLGRVREFKTGFAEISLNQRAEILPVFGSVSEKGEFYIEIREPLIPEDHTVEFEAQVTSLVTQYAQILEDEWVNYPAGITWEQLAYYFSLPACQS